MRAAQSTPLAIRLALLLTLILGWAAPCLALTELSGSPPWTMSIDGETYQFAAALGDSIEYTGSSAVVSITCDNCTLNARNFLVTRPTGRNELVSASGTNWRVNQFRGRNHYLDLSGSGVIDGCELRTMSTSSSGSTLTTSAADGIDIWNTRISAVTGSDMILLSGTNIRFENCLLVSKGAGSETVTVQTDGVFSFIGCTIDNTVSRECIQTDQSSGTLTLWNNVLTNVATSAPLNATNAAFSGLTATHNWYYRSGGGTLVTYGGINYTDAETFESNSRDGDPGLANQSAGDYRAAQGSGVVNVGDSSRNTLTLDIVGAPRERGVIDMGAYEYQPSDNGSCCFADGSCVVTTEDLCLASGEEWTEGGACIPNPCDQVGACCVGGLDDCEITIASLCDGTFLGEGTECDPGVCVFGCPPPGYTEIESLPIQIGANNSKWALCQDFTVSTLEPWGTNDWAIIDIQANNVSLTGMGYTITLDPDMDTSAMDRVHGIALTGAQDGLTIRDLTLDWESNGDTDRAMVFQGITTLRNVTVRTNAGAFHYEPKAANEFNGSLIDSCTVTVTSGPQVVTIGTGGGTLETSGFTISNSSFYSLDPNAYSCDVKNFRILFVHDGLIDNCNFVTYKAGPYSDAYYQALGGAGCAQDTEPFGFYSCSNWEIRDSRIVTFSNPAAGATGGAGYVSIRKDGDASPEGSNNFYVHDCFIWSDYLGVNASGLGEHRFVRNRIFGSMNPESGTTAGEGYTILISSTSDPCASFFESNLIVGREGETFMINNGGGADTLLNNTIVNLDEVRSDANALVQSQNTLGDCGPMVARNNLIVSSSGAAATYRKALVSGLDADLDHNLYWNRGAGPIVNWEGTDYSTIAAFRSAESQEANGLQGDPSFVSSISALSDTLTNFRLRASSIAIDEGGDVGLLFSATDLDGLDRTIGAAVDLGSYEYTDVVPTLQGACCQIDGTCTVATESDCEGLLGGTYQGDNTVCDPNPCPILTQACCFASGTCQELTPSDCTAAGGFPQGSGSDCSLVTCASPGACCLASGQCFVGGASLCGLFHGTWQGPGTDCDPNPCAQPTGACCLSEGGCVETTAALCTAGGDQYLGNGTICEADPCPPLDGACCFAFSFCQVLTGSDCGLQGGTFQGVGTSCDPNPCPETLGACCAPDGSCALDDVTDCTDAGGSWYGAGSTCTDTDCPQPTGACCLAELVGGSCIVATEAACLDANGEWTQDAHCNDVDCSRSIAGGTRVLYGEATYISSNGATLNHCDGTTLRLGGNPTPLSDGNLVIRFVSPSIPSGARVIAAEITGTVVTTTGGAEPGDIEVYQLARDPVICEATWEVYATGSDWGQDGGLAVPADRILPALTDQLGDGTTLTAGTELDLVTGPAALRFADALLRDGHAAILVTCETDHVWLSGDLGAAPVRLTLTYAVGSSRRRAVVTGE